MSPAAPPHSNGAVQIFALHSGRRRDPGMSGGGRAWSHNFPISGYPSAPPPFRRRTESRSPIPQFRQLLGPFTRYGVPTVPPHRQSIDAYYCRLLPEFTFPHYFSSRSCLVLVKWTVTFRPARLPLRCMSGEYPARGKCTIPSRKTRLVSNTSPGLNTHPSERRSGPPVGPDRRKRSNLSNLPCSGPNPTSMPKVASSRNPGATIQSC